MIESKTEREELIFMDKFKNNVLSQEEIRELVANYSAPLTDKEKKIITSRYNNDGQVQQTLQAIGNIWNLTRERIRQIILSSIEKMRFYKKQKGEVSINGKSS